MTRGNILLVGVGGQGIILAGEVLSLAFLEAGFDAKKSEVHGMSQRGGRVESHVRFGEKVDSPLVARGEVDLLLGFEMAETLRSLDWMRPGGRIFAAPVAILPYSSQVGQKAYPADALDRIRAQGWALEVVDADGLAARAGEKRAGNLVLLGRLSRELPVPPEAWEKVIRAEVPPKAVEKNLAAFHLGRESPGS